MLIDKNGNKYNIKNINKIEICNINESVYNMEVADNNSYVVGHTTVHNCDDP